MGSLCYTPTETYLCPVIARGLSEFVNFCNISAFALVCFMLSSKKSSLS